MNRPYKGTAEHAPVKTGEGYSAMQKLTLSEAVNIHSMQSFENPSSGWIG